MEPRRFTYDELCRMTANFDHARELGEGSFGVVYLGEDDKGQIAVKKLGDDRPNRAASDDRFLKELGNLKRLDHPNIVRMLGYCREPDQNAGRVHRIICFEYMPGCLKKNIQDGLPSHLNWGECYNIIRGICNGIQHSHVVLGMHHMDIKPGNVLLDEHNNAKLADFGLATIFENTGTKSTRNSYGTPRYCPPEYLSRRRLRSPTFDIYSFGVLILELVAGREACDNMLDLEDHSNMDSNTREQCISEAVQLWKQKYNDSFLESHCKQLKRCIEIGLDCVNKDTKKRPGIQNILDRLKMVENVASASNVSPQNQLQRSTPRTGIAGSGNSSSGSRMDSYRRPQTSRVVSVNNAMENLRIIDNNRTVYKHYSLRPQI
ncbi:hypothetical protein ACP4OV_014812 [Aristida adscensionis]